MEYYDTIISVIKFLVFNVGYYIAYCKVFRDNLKCSPFVVVGLMFASSMAVRLLNFVDYWPVLLYIVMSIWLNSFQALFYRDEIINCYTLDWMMQIIINLFGNGLFIVAMLIYTLFFSGSGDWLTSENSNIVSDGLLIVGAAIGNYAAYKIGAKVRECVLAYRGAVRWIMFFCFVVINIATEVYKDATVVGSYSSDPRGAAFFIDIIDLTLGIICIAATMIIYMKNKKKENELIERKTAEEYRDFRKTMMLWQTLRELNHDLNNYLTTGSAVMKEQIRKYCRQALATSEETVKNEHY